MEDGRSAFKILTGKPTGKRPLGRPRRRWEDNIRMNLEEIGINAGNWVDSAQDRNYWRTLVKATLNLREAMKSSVRVGGRGLKNLTYPYMGVGPGLKIAKIIVT